MNPRNDDAQGALQKKKKQKKPKPKPNQPDAAAAAAAAPPRSSTAADDNDTDDDDEAEADSAAASSTASQDEPLVVRGGGQNYNDCYSLLICSASGTGKSTLIQRFCNTPPLAQKELYIYCNNKSFEDQAEASRYAAELLLPRAKPLNNLREATTLPKHAIVVVEDIQNFSTAELILVKDLLFFCRRHRYLHLFFACHVVLKSGLMNILNNFDGVAVLNYEDNRESFMEIASKRKFNKCDREQKWKELRASGDPYAIMVFTGGRNGRRATLLKENRNPTLPWLNSGADAAAADPPQAERIAHLEKEAIDEMLNSFAIEKRNKARALFRLVQSSQSMIFDVTDYSVHMKNKAGRVMACSIFDYIASCVGELEPSLAVALLHRYLCCKIVIPSYLVCAKMKRVCEELKKEQKKRKN